jgi:N6-adenosine-specific RNA methylase IME4
MGFANRMHVSRLQDIATIPESERKAAIATLKADPNGHVTTNAVMRLVTRNAKEAHLAAMRARPNVFSEDGPFAVMVIDFPWPQSPHSNVALGAADYPRMSLEDIHAFGEKLRQRAEPDCHVFSWATQGFLGEMFSIMEKSIGADRGETFVWHKAGGCQPIGHPQYNCEFVVYGKIGKPEFIDTKDFFTCFEAPRREHSRKPDEFYDVIRRVTAGPRLDAFSREKREGFAQYGNEIDKFDAVPKAA